MEAKEFYREKRKDEKWKKSIDAIRGDLMIKFAEDYHKHASPPIAERELSTPDKIQEEAEKFYTTSARQRRAFVRGVNYGIFLSGTKTRELPSDEDIKQESRDFANLFMKDNMDYDWRSLYTGYLKGMYKILSSKQGEAKEEGKCKCENCVDKEYLKGLS
jgi:hypothetical protein